MQHGLGKDAGFAAKDIVIHAQGTSWAESSAWVAGVANHFLAFIIAQQPAWRIDTAITGKNTTNIQDQLHFMATRQLKQVILFAEVENSLFAFNAIPSDKTADRGEVQLLHVQHISFPTTHLDISALSVRAVAHTKLQRRFLCLHRLSPDKTRTPYTNLAQSILVEY